MLSQGGTEQIGKVTFQTGIELVIRVCPAVFDARLLSVRNPLNVGECCFAYLFSRLFAKISEIRWGFAMPFTPHAPEPLTVICKYALIHSIPWYTTAF